MRGRAGCIANLASGGEGGTGVRGWTRRRTRRKEADACGILFSDCVFGGFDSIHQQRGLEFLGE